MSELDSLSVYEREHLYRIDMAKDEMQYGISFLDDALEGILPHDLTIITGRTGRIGRILYPEVLMVMILQLLQLGIPLIMLKALCGIIVDFLSLTLLVHIRLTFHGGLIISFIMNIIVIRLFSLK